MFKKASKNSNVGKQWEEFFKDKQDFEGSLPLNGRPEFISLLLDEGLVERNDVVLDCGCGNGRTTLQLAAEGLQVIALDYSQIMIDRARRLIDRAKEKGLKLKVSAVRGDMTALPFANAVCDVALSIGAVEHWLNDDQRFHVIREMKRITRSGGRVILMVPNGRNPLYGIWRFIIKQDTPEEVRYSAESLAEEIKSISFSKVHVFPMGLNPDFSKYLRFKILKWPLLFCNGIVSHLPLFLRLKLTVHFTVAAELK